MGGLKGENNPTLVEAVLDGRVDHGPEFDGPHMDLQYYEEARRLESPQQSRHLVCGDEFVFCELGQ
jgi:hypothetical protein